MFIPVKRWKRILVQVLVVAQIVCAAPVASALPAGPGAEEMPCAGMMGMEAMHPDLGSDHCPCCPEGTDSVAACLAACAVAAGITDSYAMPVISAGTPRAPLPIVTTHSRRFDPPLKPPPIV
jgi:hypothetical protein